MASLHDKLVYLCFTNHHLVIMQHFVKTIAKSCEIFKFTFWTFLLPFLHFAEWQDRVIVWLNKINSKWNQKFALKMHFVRKIIPGISRIYVRNSFLCIQGAHLTWYALKNIYICYFLTTFLRDSLCEIKNFDEKLTEIIFQVKIWCATWFSKV